MTDCPPATARLYRAAWVLPIEVSPVRDGWVAVRGGRVTAVGGGRPPAGAPPDTDLGSVAVLPGLVNAHTHLELSGLRGRVPPAASMPMWVCDLLAARGLEPPPVPPIVEAIGEAHRSGTILVGDVGNSLATVGPLAAGPLFAVVFHELLGFKLPDPDLVVRRAGDALGPTPAPGRVRTTLAVHAPYSSSPGLFRAVRAWMDRTGAAVTSVHVGESAEELQFLRDASGPWRMLLDSLKAWNPDWTPPACDPVSYLDGLGALDRRVLAVHGVQLDAPALARLRASGATLVTCPRSNQWVGAGVPPVARFYASGVRVAVGTDSLASVDDLNLFAELAALRRLAPAVPARALLESATRSGAEALGFGGELGTLAPSARAALLAVNVPRDVADVEEYLVSGIQPSAVRWVAA